MSLRLRAVLIAGLALVLLWAIAAAVMIRGVQANLDQMLDERLAMSARMVSGLLQRAAIAPEAAPQHWADIIRVSGANGIACEVRSMQGTVLARTESGPYSTMDSPALGFSTRDVDGEPWRIHILDDANGYRIMTADRVARRHGLAREMLRAAGVPFLVAVSGGLLALWIGIDRGLAPLAALRRRLADRRDDDTRPIADTGAPSELKPLLAAFNGVLSRLSSTLAGQRAFTDAAAHELRTPLTAIDTHLQVAQLATGEQARTALAQAGRGVQRMRHTLEQMMVLARSEAPPDADDICNSAARLVEDVLGRLDPAARSRIQWQPGTVDCAPAMPRSLLETALRNLVDNALRYAPAPSPITVSLQCEPSWRRLTLAVADRGPGLVPAQRAHVGQRFWRGDRARHGDGAGLGLSIVHAIATRFDGSLRLEARDGGGLVAILDLPIAGA
ncbi:MAG: sensor histidine kinase N-terminal domain-containing protein [Xanthomonadales bacterium]|nr:sensor histidine kinase N-terminal domain-containing protein [Xanthomonadales bacterium]